jgi:hypothetical protein
LAACILRLSQDEGVVLGLGIFRSAVSGGGGKGGVADSAGNVAADVSGKLEVDRVDGSGFHILAEEEFGDSDGSQRREQCPRGLRRALQELRRRRERRW